MSFCYFSPLPSVICGRYAPKSALPSSAVPRGPVAVAGPYVYIARGSAPEERWVAAGAALTAVARSFALTSGAP